MQYIIAASRDWYHPMTRRLAEQTGNTFHLVTDKSDLTLERIEAINPRFVFFPHWSYLIPAEIHERFECVIFHMTDVPFGRGGSPLQNLIAQGIYQTKMTALRCSNDIDAGPVYLKRDFSLHGNAEEIYLRAADCIEGMITELIRTKPEPVPQSGDIVQFARRKPADGDLAQVVSLREVFDYIRMLDAEGYPPAFLETEQFRLEFQRPALRKDDVVADVRITRKPHV